LIVGDPSRAFALSTIPNAGVGLARTEFIVTHHVGVLAFEGEGAPPVMSE
jgi:phosphoenolpyruvate synthase/pyruvate phosphate dikinase